MPQVGDILYVKKFPFPDGEKGPKLFIILCESNTTKPCLALKTTSKVKPWYSNSHPGCNPQKKVFYIPVEWNEYFSVDTYIQLPEIIPFKTIDLLQDKFHDNLQVYEKVISQNCIAQIKNCLKKYFKEDISEYYWKLIFKK